MTKLKMRDILRPNAWGDCLWCLVTVTGHRIYTCDWHGGR